MRIDLFKNQKNLGKSLKQKYIFLNTHLLDKYISQCTFFGI